MLLNSEAYHACIVYFSDNFVLFESANEPATGELISDIVTDQVAEMLLTFFPQQTQLSHQVRLNVISEGDKVVEDIEQILGRFWNKPATVSQTEFIKEYFLLLKNSLDSQAFAHNS